MAKYLVSHKGVSIYFDDHGKCLPHKGCGRQEMIMGYLRGMAKLIATVNLNDDWVIFGKHMEVVVEELMNHDDRHKKEKDKR